MISESFAQRLKDLEDHVRQDLLLLKRYEDALRLETDPRIQMRYERQIDNLKQSADRYQQEAENLQKQLLREKSDDPQNISNRLDVLASDLKILQTGQIAIFGQLNQTRQLLVERYANAHQVAIAETLNQLSQSQLEIVEVLLNSLDTDQLSELEIKQIWIALEDRFKALPSGQGAIAEILKNPQLDMKHRLKAAIPIIPLLLDYEFEIELGSEMNIRRIWEYIKSRI